MFTPDITLIPHSLSTELADILEQPVTVEDFQSRTGGNPVSLYVTSNWDLMIRVRMPDGRELFAQGPEQFPVYVS
jgi:hypothetical protein